MRRFLGIVLAVLILAGCATSTQKNPDKPIRIYNSGKWIAECSTIDEEKRIAYDCFVFVVGKVDEYHLSLYDAWSRSQSLR